MKTTLIPFNQAVTTNAIESRIKFIEFHRYYPSIENHSNPGGDPQWNTPPSQAAPWVLAIDDELRSVFFHVGRPLYGPLPPCHLPNGENTKAWDLITDGNSDPDEWSHSWQKRKSISLMEKTIIDSGNGEKVH